MDRSARGTQRRRTAHSTGRERGTTIVEAALVIPLLLTVLFGIIEFGFAYNDYLSVRSAAREGARLAAVDNSCVGSLAASCGSADAQRDKLLADTLKKVSGISTATGVSVSVWLPDGSTAVGKDVAVSLSVPMKSRTGLFAPFVNPITLKATARMRLEQRPTFTAGTACDDLAGTTAGAGPKPAC